LKNSRQYSKEENVQAHEELIQIIEGCKKNDRVCQQKLYKLLYSKMMSVCLRYTNNKESAEDLLQDGFIKLFHNISKFNQTGNIEGWCRRLFVNLALDNFRKNKRNIVQSISENIENYEIEDEKEDFNYEDKIAPQIVLQEIQNLSPAYQLVFNLYVMENYTHKEIAEMLNISEGTSKSNLAKAKQNLRNRLQKYISHV
jgi:RNA polymerase sigma factor (sigma-70 family)